MIDPQRRNEKKEKKWISDLKKNKMKIRNSLFAV
jgi:hypothetical protein